MYWRSAKLNWGDQWGTSSRYPGERWEWLTPVSLTAFHGCFRSLFSHTSSWFILHLYWVPPMCQAFPFRPLGNMWQNQDPGSSVRMHHRSPPIASQTTARSLLMCGFTCRLQQVTYSWGTLITVIAWVRSLSPQPGLPVPVTSKSTG